jgi:drug/metabolite transporter (DMT)-like permease
MNPRLVAVLQTLAALSAASFVGVLAKIALEEVPGFSFAWVQVAIGAVMMTLYTFVLKRERIPRGLGRQVWWLLLGIGLCSHGLARVSSTLALERLPATTHIYVINFAGIVTMLFSVFLLSERPSRLQILGALLALAGLRVFFWNSPPTDQWEGLGWGAVCVFGLALNNNLARKLALHTGGKLSHNVIATLALWMGGLPLVTAGLVIDGVPPIVGWRNWAIVSLNALFVIAITLTVWNNILRTLRSYEAAVLGSATVIFTALFAIPILGERLRALQMIGIAMMMGGLALAQLRRKGFRCSRPLRAAPILPDRADLPGP